MPDKMVKMLSTWFFIGCMPLAPGTFGSAAAVALAWLCSFHWVGYVGITIVVTVVGIYVCGRMEGILSRKDPGCIVIDEVAGIMISFFMLPVHSLPVVIITFFLFRAFDMFKIYPACEFEKLEGGLGVMADDLFAGLYTNVVMQIALRWAAMI